MADTRNAAEAAPAQEQSGASQPTEEPQPEAEGQPQAEQPQPGAEGQPQAEAGERPQPAAGEPPQAEAGERPQPEAEDEAKLVHDLEELAAKAEKADEYLELAQRTKADFENYRKRAAREAAAAQERGVIKLALELLPAIDDLDRALQASDGETAEDTLRSGVKLVHAALLAALARCGIEPYSPSGERFDPQHHEAVAQQPADGVEPGTIIEVYQRGYRLGDSVLRPARVAVAAGAERGDGGQA